MSIYSVGVAPGGLPVVGHALDFARDPLGFLESLPARGDLVQVRLGPLRAYVVCHPDLVHQVLINDRVFDKGGVIFDKAREVFGNGLGTCEHRDHRRQRRHLQPAFRRDRLASYAAAMSEQADTLSNSWRDGQVIDVPAAMHQFTCSVTVRAFFGDDIAVSDISSLQRDFDNMGSGVLRRTVLPIAALDLLPTPGNRRFNQARDRLKEIADQIISERRRTSRRPEASDILSMIVNPQDTGQYLSDSEIRDQVFTFFFGGIETAATTLSWAWHYVGQQAGLQDQLQAEVDTVLEGRLPQHDDLPRLDLATRILTETLRISPPGWLFTRKTNSDAQIAGRTLPAGTTLIYSPYLLGHRPDLYNHPGTFDPARWLDSAAPPRGAYVPFGAGARKCIGDDFAMTMATIALTSIASRWRLEHVPGAQVTPAPRAILTPRRLPMRVQRRPSTVSSSVTNGNRDAN